MHEPHSTTHDSGPPHDSGHDEAPAYDREIGYRRIIEFLAGLAVLTVVTMVLMAMMVRGFERQVAQQDPPPSPLGEASAQLASPGAQLQFFPPTADIGQLHVWEDDMLDHYAWIDEGQGMARIPVERAMEILARHGLPRIGAVDRMSEELFGDRTEMSTEVQVGADAPEGGS